MKWTRRDLLLIELREDLWQAAPWLLVVAVAGLVIITCVWGR